MILQPDGGGQDLSGRPRHGRVGPDDVVGLAGGLLAAAGTGQPGGGAQRGGLPPRGKSHRGALGLAVARAGRWGSRSPWPELALGPQAACSGRTPTAADGTQQRGGAQLGHGADSQPLAGSSGTARTSTAGQRSHREQLLTAWAMLWEFRSAALGSSGKAPAFRCQRAHPWSGRGLPGREAFKPLSGQVSSLVGKTDTGRPPRENRAQ